MMITSQALVARVAMICLAVVCSQPLVGQFATMRSFMDSDIPSCPSVSIRHLGAWNAGDFDGDGYRDYVVWVNRRSYSGQVPFCFMGSGYSSRDHVYSGRDGSLLWMRDSVAAPEIPDLLGFFGFSPLRFAGDLNGDGFADVIDSFALAIAGSSGVRLFDLGVPSVFPSFVSFWFVGDVNADGCDDFFRTEFSPQSWTVISGADNQPFPAVFNDRVQVASPYSNDGGDLDGDGRDDLLLVTHVVGIGRSVQVLSVPQLNVLLQTQPTLLPAQAREACWVGDQDLDGHDDVAILQGESFQVLSGATQLPLAQATLAPTDGGIQLDYLPNLLGDGVGYVVASNHLSFPDKIYRASDLSLFHSLAFNEEFVGVVGDTNSNGRTELALKVVRELKIVEWTSPDIHSGSIVLGAGCQGLDGRIRRIDLRGTPRLGTTTLIRLEAGRSNFSAVLHFGVPFATPVPLDFLGGGSCILRTLPFVTVGAGTNGNGFASVPLTLPLDAAPAGFEYSAQWIMWDPGANALGVTMSGELRLRLRVGV